MDAVLIIDSGGPRLIILIHRKKSSEFNYASCCKKELRGSNNEREGRVMTGSCFPVLRSKRIKRIQRKLVIVRYIVKILTLVTLVFAGGSTTKPRQERHVEINKDRNIEIRDAEYLSHKYSKFLVQ